MQSLLYMLCSYAVVGSSGALSQDTVLGCTAYHPWRPRVPLKDLDAPAAETVDNLDGVVAAAGHRRMCAVLRRPCAALNGARIGTSRGFTHCVLASSLPLELKEAAIVLRGTGLNSTYWLEQWCM